MNEEVVAAYLEDQAKLSFVWGVSDCVQLAGGLIERLTGINPAVKWVYGSEREAKELIAREGGLRAMVAKELGEPLSLFAHGDEIESGDIVLATYGSIGEIIGIAYARRAWYRSARGIVPVQLEQCLCFWKSAECLPR